MLIFGRRETIKKAITTKESFCCCCITGKYIKLDAHCVRSSLSKVCHDAMNAEKETLFDMCSLNSFIKKNFFCI